MFNKEKSNKVTQIGNINFSSFKKVGAAIIASVLLTGTIGLANKTTNNAQETSSPSTIERQIDQVLTGGSEFDQSELERIQRINEMKINEDIDRDILELYDYGKLEVGDKLIPLFRIYIAYGYDANNNFVSYFVIPTIGSFNFFTGEKIELQKTNVVQFRQTSLFVDFVKEGFMTVENGNLIITGSPKEMNEMVQSWNGEIQKLVPETQLLNIDVIEEVNKNFVKTMGGR